MIWLVLALVCLAVVARGFRSRSAKGHADLNPEEAMRAAAELHVIRRRLDVSLTKSEQRRDAARLRHAIDNALDGLDDAP